MVIRDICIMRQNELLSFCIDTVESQFSNNSHFEWIKIEFRIDFQTSNCVLHKKQLFNQFTYLLYIFFYIRFYALFFFVSNFMYEILL